MQPFRFLGVRSARDQRDRVVAVQAADSPRFLVGKDDRHRLAAVNRDMRINRARDPEPKFARSHPVLHVGHAGADGAVVFLESFEPLPSFALAQSGEERRHMRGHAAKERIGNADVPLETGVGQVTIRMRTRRRERARPC